MASNRVNLDQGISCFGCDSNASVVCWNDVDESLGGTRVYYCDACCPHVNQWHDNDWVGSDPIPNTVSLAATEDVDYMPSGSADDMAVDDDDTWDGPREIKMTVVFRINGTKEHALKLARNVNKMLRVAFRSLYIPFQEFNDD